MEWMKDILGWSQPKGIVRGYKATYNMKCINLTYEVGKTYEIDDMEMCWHGFHFCQKMEDVLEYYHFSSNFVLLEVEALGGIETEGNKSVTNKMKVLRVVPEEEYNFDFKNMEYDSKGNLTHFKNSGGYERWNVYDSDGNMIYCEDSDGYKSWHEYDVDGNQIYCKFSNIHESWNEHDLNGNTICMKTANGDKTRFVYDNNGDMIYVKYFNGVERWYEYDSKGNAISYRDSNGIKWNITITS